MNQRLSRRLDFMKRLTNQEKIWGGGFGTEFTRRNYSNIKNIASFDKLHRENFGIGREELYRKFIGNLDRSAKILEVGSNIGTQLALLRKIGFSNLYGVEINRDAVIKSRHLFPDINVVEGSAFDIPFKDGFFDLVFTAAVLIHFPRPDIKRVMSEMYRCSKKYIWGYEYYADKHTEIVYRGNRNILWKGNFAGKFLNLFKDLRLIKKKEMPYLSSANVDMMYLLKKNRI